MDQESYEESELRRRYQEMTEVSQQILIQGGGDVGRVTDLVATGCKQALEEVANLEKEKPSVKENGSD